LETDRPFLSIIIPAHNEERRLPGSLEKIVAFLEKQDYQAEVIVVDNGSRDNTSGVVEGFMARYPFISLIREERRGKGLAVKLGMLAARGEYLFLCDADLSMPIEEVAKFLPPQLEDYDVAIASREVEGARRYGEPPHRHLMGRVFNLIVRLLAVRGFQDTQCGFKCFRREVARDPPDHGGLGLRRGGAVHRPEAGLPHRRGAHQLVLHGQQPGQAHQGLHSHVPRGAPGEDQRLAGGVR